MGHHITAAVLRGDFDAERAAEFDLKPIPRDFGLTLFPLDPNYTDFWADKLDIHGFVTDRPLLNCNVVHHMMREIAPDPLFAIIETDYFGGKGDQCAVVYHGERELMPPQSKSRGPINKALRHLGMGPAILRDQFTALGLDNYRDWDELFDKYYGDEP